MTAKGLTMRRRASTGALAALLLVAAAPALRAQEPAAAEAPLVERLLQRYGEVVDLRADFALREALAVAGLVEPTRASVRVDAVLLDGALHHDAAALAEYRSIHTPPPAYLARVEATVEAVRRGEAGPEATPEAVRAFLLETYEHSRDVETLTRALGAEPAGAHDLEERVPVERVRALVERLRREPLCDADGVPREVPYWLLRLARAPAGSLVDVSKLSPHVAAGLGREGAPEPFALELHRLSEHHGAAGSAEWMADVVNAMRQPRIYRREPTSFERIRWIIEQDAACGRVPAEALPLLTRALEAQARLESEWRVNPYYLAREGGAGTRPLPPHWVERALAAEAALRLRRAGPSADRGRAIAAVIAEGSARGLRYLGDAEALPVRLRDRLAESARPPRATAVAGSAGLLDRLRGVSGDRRGRLTPPRRAVRRAIRR